MPLRLALARQRKSGQLGCACGEATTIYAACTGGPVAPMAGSPRLAPLMWAAMLLPARQPQPGAAPQSCGPAPFGIAGACSGKPTSTAVLFTMLFHEDCF